MKIARWLDQKEENAFNEYANAASFIWCINYLLVPNS